MLPIEKEIRELEQFDCRGARALTLYVRTDPAREDGRNLPAQLAALLQPIRDSLLDDPVLLSAFQRDVDTAHAELFSMRPPPRAAALFVCTARLLAYVVPLRFPVIPQACWDNHLHLKPLLAQMDEHERALVVLVDKERLRLFRTFLGSIEVLNEFTDDVPGKHRLGGESQQKQAGRAVVHMGYQPPNVHDHAVRKHLDRVLGAMKAAYAQSPADHILMAATPEVRAEFMQLLPRRWRRALRGELSVSTRATPAEVLAAVNALQERMERRAEIDLVARALELDAAHAALGPAAVAEAVANGEVLTLIYAAGLELSGRVCESCGWLMPGPGPAYCGRCHATTSEVADLIDSCIERVLKAGGYVEEVRSAAAIALQQASGIAAICRFMNRVPTAVTT